MRETARPVAAHGAMDAVVPILVAAAVGLIGFLLLGRILTVPLRIPLSYNEGWNAYFAVRAVFGGGLPLYPPPGGLVTNNYPPLSFYLVGLLGRFVVGDMIVAGRAVALASMLGVAALLALCVRRLGGNWRAGGLAAMLMLLLAGTFYRDYVAMNDPQWLAQALMLAGLAIMLRGLPAGVLPARDIVVAALLMLAGGLVKHNPIGLPIAVTVWLAGRDRHACLIWIVTGALALGVVAGVAYGCYGPVVFADILHTPRVISLARLPKVSLTLLPLLPMAALAFAVLRPRADAAGRLVTVFVGAAAVSGLLQRVGEGVSYNAYFETLAAACLAFGVALSRLPHAAVRVGRYRIGGLAMVMVAVLPVVCTLPGPVRAAWADLAERRRRQAHWAPVIAGIASVPGPALCETLALCYWAGKPFSVDMFNLGQAVLAGRGAALAVNSTDGGFGIVEYQFQSSIHTDFVRQLGRDPLMDRFVGQCTGQVFGPHGLLLIQPHRR